MPGLDLSQISGNWKKLQEQLRSEKKSEPQSQIGKRKRLNGTNESANRVKKAKVSHPRPSRPRGSESMDVNGSKNGEPSTQTKAQYTLAERLGVSQEDISAAYGSTNASALKYIDDVNGGHHPTHKLGKYVAIDCEMVGTGPPPHEDNVLARVSLVNFNGEQIYDSYVLPPPGVIVEDYRTFVSGIKKSHLVQGYARPLTEVQEDVSDIMHGRILVGHALYNDLQVLLLSHPKRDLRDTSRHPKFRIESKGRPPALRHLAKSELGMQIQAGEHSSIEDAGAAMMLFKKEKAGFEEENRKRFGVQGKPGVRAATKAASQTFSKASIKNRLANGNDDGAGDEEDLALLEGEESDQEVVGGELTQDKPAKVTVKKKHKNKKRTKRK